MGFWNKLGKLALTVAPYVAAPFTGGASLMAAPATDAALKAWTGSDAKKAAAKGLAPSNFDKILGTASTGASIASSFGAFNKLGKLGSAKGTTAAKGTGKSAGLGGLSKMTQPSKSSGGWQSQLGKILPAVGAIGTLGSIIGGRGGSSDEPVAVSSARPRNEVMPRGGYRYRDNPMNQLDQSSPNLSQSIFQGRQESIGNQPFRRGYEVNAIGQDDTPIRYEMPRISPAPKGRKRAS